MTLERQLEGLSVLDEKHALTYVYDFKIEEAKPYVLAPRDNLVNRMEGIHNILIRLF